MRTETRKQLHEALDEALDNLLSEAGLLEIVARAISSVETTERNLTDTVEEYGIEFSIDTDGHSSREGSYRRHAVTAHE
jgi:histidinol phosphatase-like PHP family hydrolase